MRDKPEGYRTGSMTILEDDVDIDIQDRRVETEERWCCIVPTRDGLVFPDSVGKMLFKWQMLNRRWRTKMETLARSNQSVLVVLPAGVEPKDLKVSKWVKT